MAVTITASIRSAVGVTVTVAVVALSGCGSSALAGSDDAIGGDGLDGGGEVAVIQCGNGTLDPGEECDDGNRLNGDGCDWRCMLGEGDDPPIRPPDPDAGHAVVEVEPTTVDLGIPDAIAMFINSRRPVPLVWAHDAYATVWLTRLDDTGSFADGTFLRFDKAGHRVGSTWTYHLVAGFCGTWSYPPWVDLAANSAGYGMVYTGRDGECPLDEGRGLTFQLLYPDGKPAAESVVLSTWATAADRLGLVWDGDGFGVACDALASRESDFTLGFLPLDPTGRPRRTPRVVVMADADGFGVDSLASSGDVDVFAWDRFLPESGWQAGYSAVTRDGVVLGSVGLGFGDAADVVWSGEEFGIAWVSPPCESPERKIMFARLSADGELVAPPEVLWDSPGQVPSMISISFGNNSYAVGGYTGRVLQVVRADRHGTLVDHVSAAGLLDISWASRFIGSAADDGGFGFITAGPTTASTEHPRPGPPVFARIRVDP